MTDLLRRPKTYIFLFLGIVVIYGVAALAGSFSGDIPESFRDARLEGALISQSIVEASAKSVETLKTINQYDREGNSREALNLVAAEVTRASELRNEAVKLSQELEKMTRALSDLSSFEARQAALEAISNHLAVISRLVNYSGYLSKLLEVLSDRFTGNLSDGSQVSLLVDQINAEVNAINSFSSQATEAMRRFDELVR